MITPDQLGQYSLRLLEEPYASLLNGMVLGTPVPKVFSSYEAVHRAGLVHVLVLSGGNLTLLGRTIEVITDGVNKRIQLVLILLALTFFCLFVGFKAPLMRAYGMSAFTIVALLIGRPLLGIAGLFFSGIVVLLLDREVFASVSFQLSYSATLGILCFTPLIESYLKKLRIGRLIRAELATSLGAQILTTPIIAYYFHEVSLISLVANILVSLVIPPIFVIGLLFYIASSIAPLLGQLVGYLALPLLWYFLLIARLVTMIPYGWYTW